jgi:hypothetical protein
VAGVYGAERMIAEYMAVYRRARPESLA